MLHALQREARKYHLELNIGKTCLMCNGAARAQPTNLQDLDGRPIQVTDSHGTLGFIIRQTDRVSSQVCRCGSAMLKDMDQYRLVWKSSSTRSLPLFTGSCPGALGGASVDSPPRKSRIFGMFAHMLLAESIQSEVSVLASHF